MLDLLFNDIINNVVTPRQTTSLTESHSLTEKEVEEILSRAATILETIPDDAEEYLGYLDSFIQDYQERCSEGKE